MKKLFLIVLLAFSAVISVAQDLDEINELMGKSKYKEAKIAIDKYMAAPKNVDNSEGWYYKGRIYNALSYDSTVPLAEIYSLKTSAYDAFKKNQQLDPKDIRLLFETHNSYLDLYFGFYDLGAKQFNAKNYDMALESFKKAIEVKDYILEKKYEYSQAKLYHLDTALVLNAAASAVQGKKEEEAVTFYRKLTDANVTGKDYADVYIYLADYYNKKEDEASLGPLLEKAKRFYPQNEFWADLEIRSIGKKGDKQALFAKYDEMLTKDPTNFTLSYNYGIELYNSIYGKDAKPGENSAAKDKLTSVLKIAIGNDKGIDATVLMANHLFNMAADQLNAANMIKSTKPDDVKKKTELKGQSNKTMDECITYAETAVKYFEANHPLKGIQRANYKIVLGYLSDIYSLKNNPKKAAEYEAKNKAADKM